MEDDIVISISTGKIRGIIQEDVNGDKFYSFYGIPFARPPIGSLRFKAPQPALPWKDVRDCTEEGPPSVQKDLMTRQIVGSEDCLHLNVYTKNITSTDPVKPVMVFVHGGAFIMGSNSPQVYGPQFLIAEDIVLVTVNYRLGCFGFLSIDDENLDVPGNAAFKDVVLSLKWVQQNIKIFGGDPKNVTLFGESAGAASVHLLMLSPQTKGLFHKVICQSGSAINGWAYGKSTTTQEVAKYLKLNYEDKKSLLEYLQNMTTEELYNMQQYLEELDDMANRSRFWGLVLEKPSINAFLTKHPWDLVKYGEFNHLPIIMGYNNSEGMLYKTLVKKSKKSSYWKNSSLNVPHLLGVDNNPQVSKVLGDKILKYYLGNPPYDFENHEENMFLVTTDNCFVWGIYHCTRCHAKTSKYPIYFYRMSIETELNIYKKLANITIPGVSHADDLGYLFQSVVTPQIEPNSPEDISRRRFCKLWTNFAKFSNPTPTTDNLVTTTWHPVKPKVMNFLDIDKDLSEKIRPERRRMEFWDDIYALKETKSSL